MATMNPGRSLAVLVCASTLLGLLTGLPLAAPLAGADPPVMHSAGHINITYTDAYTETIHATVFYPATSEGLDAPPSASGAPYPTVVVVPDRGRSMDPAFAYAPYGVNLSRNGYVVAIVNISVHEVQPTSHARMANSTLDAIDALKVQNTSSTSRLEGMVDASRVALVGHGQGARVALLAAAVGGPSRVHAVACLALVDGIAGGAGAAAPLAGRLGIPIHIQGGTNDTVADHDDWTRAFNAKATGYVSLHVIAGANHTRYIQGSWPSDAPVTDGVASISRVRQQQLALRYVLAFLDFHLEGDALSASVVYGAEALADLVDRILDNWQYGVVDESVEFTRPGQSAMVPAGSTEFCATVINVGAFPMLARNVTLEVARMEGTGMVVVYDKVNRTAGAMMPGARSALSWTVTLLQYGDYRAFLTMDDPDHNRSNDRAVLAFTVSALPPAIIIHTPVDAVELGEALDLTVRFESVSGVQDAWVNLTDPDGLVVHYALEMNSTTGVWHAGIPGTSTVGLMSYTINVVAGNNATNATGRYFVPVLDTTAPVIEHTPPGPFLRVREAFEMRANVTDLGGVSSVRLAFTDPTTGFHNSTCGRRDDVWYYPMALGPDEGDLTYQWWAQDVWGNAVALGPFELEVRDMGPPVITPIDPGPILLGTDFGLTANITDDALIASVWLVYTAPGATGAVNGTAVLQGAHYRLTIGGLTVPGTLVYEWGAVDVNGHSTTTGPIELQVLDANPPVITRLEFGDAVAGHAPWVTAEVHDDGPLARVQLEFTDVLGAFGSVPMVEQSPGVYRGTMPVQGRGGEVVFRVAALDQAGNQATSGDRTMVVRDMNPPTVMHTPPTAAEQGSDIQLRVNVSDDIGVARVVLELKLSPMGAFQRIDMQSVAPGVWEHVIRGDGVNPPEIVYYFEATDLLPSANVARDPVDAPSSVYRLVVGTKLLAVHGIVKDRDGRPIQGARVEVVGTDIVTVTGANGSYRLEGLTVGTHTLWVWAEGFEEVRLDILVTVEGGDRKQDFTLVVEPDAVDGDDPNLVYAAVAVLVIALAVIILAVRLRAARGGPRGGRR